MVVVGFTTRLVRLTAPAFHDTSPLVQPEWLKIVLWPLVIVVFEALAEILQTGLTKTVTSLLHILPVG